MLLFLLNAGCESYYENDKNPFKLSGQCIVDKYLESSYNKVDLADENFGHIGVVSNSDEYPRAGIDRIFTSNNNKKLQIEGSFASLCESSTINKVKVDLYNLKNQKKTYYPNIRNGYSGDFFIEINPNQNNNDRCFFQDTKLDLKTWARDEDGNTYFAHNYSSSPVLNVKSDISWHVSYDYNDRNEYKNYKTYREIKYEEEYEEEEGIKYTYVYQYTHKYEYEYQYADRYSYRYPVVMYIHGNNEYAGEYTHATVNTDLIEFGTLPISNSDRRVSFLIKPSNTKSLEVGVAYNFSVSFIEKLAKCYIQSKVIKKNIRIPDKYISNISYNILKDTKKTLLNTIKILQSKTKKDEIE